MQRKYTNLRSSDIIRYFPVSFPCACYGDRSSVYETPYYNVTITTDSSTDNPNAEITYIEIACTCCDQTKEHNVERFHISPDKLNWKRKC